MQSHGAHVAQHMRGFGARSLRATGAVGAFQQAIAKVEPEGGRAEAQQTAKKSYLSMPARAARQRRRDSPIAHAKARETWPLPGRAAQGAAQH